MISGYFELVSISLFWLSICVENGTSSLHGKINGFLIFKMFNDQNDIQIVFNLYWQSSICSIYIWYMYIYHTTSRSSFRTSSKWIVLYWLTSYWRIMEIFIHFVIKSTIVYHMHSQTCLNLSTSWYKLMNNCYIYIYIHFKGYNIYNIDLWLFIPIPIQ